MMWEHWEPWAVRLFIVTLAAFVAFAAAPDHRKVNDLQKRVGCLERPHGESSVAGVMRHGRFVVIRPVHRTGCP